jgi:uncharacterized protein involved in exopolysaccharide biosynthesis
MELPELRSNAPIPRNPYLRDISEIPEQSRRDFFRIIFRQKLKILLFFFLITGAAAFMASRALRTYESEAKIMVRVGREMLSDDPLVRTGEARSSTSSTSYADQMESEVAILKSRIVAAQTVDQIGVEAFLANEQEEPAKLPRTQIAEVEIPSETPPRERIINRVMDNLTAKHRGGIITVSFTATDPHLAQRTLDTLVENYVKRHIEVFRAEVSSHFFTERSTALAAQLTHDQSAYEKFCKAHGVVNLEEQKRGLLGQVGDLQSRIYDIDAEISGSLAMISSYKEMLKNPEPKIAKDSTTVSSDLARMLNTRLLDLMFKQAEISAKYPKDSKEMRDIEQQIELTRTLIAKEKERGSGALGEGVDTDKAARENAMNMEQAHLAALQAKKQFLEEELAQRRKALNEFSELEGEIAKLKRNISLSEQEYLKYRDNLQGAEISAALDRANISNVKVLQPATLPVSPLKPRRTRMMAIGLFIAFFGSFGLAFVFEYFDHSLKTTEEVERHLGLPVLASIPKVKKRELVLVTGQLGREERLLSHE